MQTQPCRGNPGRAFARPPSRRDAGRRPGVSLDNAAMRSKSSTGPVRQMDEEVLLALAPLPRSTATLTADHAPAGPPDAALLRHPSRRAQPRWGVTSLAWRWRLPQGGEQVSTIDRAKQPPL